MIEKVLVLSTSHVPENPDFGPLRYCNHKYGWMVFLGSEDQPLPFWLRKIICEAKNKECFAVYFDADAPIEEHYRIYDW